jgi:uncharacterized membrane protein
MSVSKSLFNNTLGPTSCRSLYNPIYQNGGTADDLILLNSSFIQTLRTIEEFYAKNMALKQYEKIPNDYQRYIGLYVTMQRIINKTSSSQLRTLFRIAQEALVGAINSYTIYGDNLLLRLDKTNLQNKINDILSNKNEKLVEMANTTGQLNVKKSFKLAAVFNNYILIYGLPEYGVGFDPAKVEFLANILRKMGVNPYR